MCIYSFTVSVVGEAVPKLEQDGACVVECEDAPIDDSSDSDCLLSKPVMVTEEELHKLYKQLDDKVRKL